MEPLRDETTLAALMAAGSEQASVVVRPVSQHDFVNALCQVQPSVSAKELVAFEEWNALYGSFQNADAKRAAAAAAAAR